MPGSDPRTTVERRSGEYWEARWRNRADRGDWGRGAGKGSEGALLDWKAALVEEKVAEFQARSLLDLGCGDGMLAAKVRVREYVGLDVSVSAIELASSRGLPARYRFHVLPPRTPVGLFDYAVSMDVVQHLIEDGVYLWHLRQLFVAARKAVSIYTPDVCPAQRTAPHVLRRSVSLDVPEYFPGWTLHESVPPRWPTSEHGEEGSDSSFLTWVPE